MNQMVYLSMPLNGARRSEQERYERDRVKVLLQGQGFAVFDASSVWAFIPDSDLGGAILDSMREIYQVAIDRSDAMFVLWHDPKVPSVGVPMEIEYALSHGTPIAFVGYPVSPFLVGRQGIKVFTPGSEVNAVRWLREKVGQHERDEASYFLSTAFPATEQPTADLPPSILEGVKVAVGFERTMDSIRALLADETEAKRVYKWVSAGGARTDDWESVFKPPPRLQIGMRLRMVQERVRLFQEAKGWLHDGRTFGDDLMLWVTEIAEAMEEFRAGRRLPDTYFEHAKKCTRKRKGLQDAHEGPCTNLGDPETILGWPKPCGIPSEFADLIIRVLGSCNEWGIDLEEALRLKLDYNDTREHRHGGKKL